VKPNRRHPQARPLLDDPARDELLELVGLFLMGVIFLIVVGVAS
jgi:hypothetical protein